MDIVKFLTTLRDDLARYLSISIFNLKRYFRFQVLSEDKELMKPLW